MSELWEIVEYGDLEKGDKIRESVFEQIHTVLDVAAYEYDAILKLKFMNFSSESTTKRRRTRSKPVFRLKKQGENPNA